MGPRADLCARALLAVLAVALLFWARWRPELQHFDWQVWEASNNLLNNGDNPYDVTVLNTELQSNEEAYGDQFNQDQQFMYLSNPPTWITTIRAFGVSIFLLSLVGALALFGSIVAFSKDRPFLDTVYGILGAGVYFYLSPGSSTFRFGQAGLFIAGLIALHVLLLERRSWGVPVSLLSTKPHLAAAAGLTGLAHNPRRAALLVAVPYSILVLATTALFGLRPWTQWIGALLGGSALPENSLPDMSFATLTPLLPWRDLGLFGVVIGIAIGGAIAWRGRHAAPLPIAFACLAVTIYFSGHAFMHDWLWIPIVPVALKWNPMLGFVGVSTVAVALQSRTHVPDLPVGYQSIIGLLLMVIILVAASEAIRNADHVPNDIDDAEPLPASKSLAA